MTDNDTNTEAEAQEPALSREALLALSPVDWARFGVHHIAYCRPALINGQLGVAIHAADGTPIGAAPNAVLAEAAIREHEMVPATLQ
ncbi:MAG TPA: hypothetical protein VD970_15960 [Acetobacteraceae bacterium]|nr:hypothetical protein [Acetobacteraceae bacterium]